MRYIELKTRFRLFISRKSIKCMDYVFDRKILRVIEVTNQFKPPVEIHLNFGRNKYIMSLEEFYKSGLIDELSTYERNHVNHCEEMRLLGEWEASDSKVLNLSTMTVSR